MSDSLQTESNVSESVIPETTPKKTQNNETFVGKGAFVYSLNLHPPSLQDKFNRDSLELCDEDTESGLSLYTSTKFSNDSDDLTRHSKSLVFHGDKLISMGFGYSEEYSCADQEQLTNIFTSRDDFLTSKFFESHEGAIIRLFFFNKKWFCMTSRKLNAFDSKWSSSRSFGELFRRAIEFEYGYKDLKNFIQERKDRNVFDSFLASLNRNKQYLFLVRNTSENRIVCEGARRPEVYHVGTVLMDKRKLNIFDYIGVSKVRKLGFSDLNNFTDFVSKVDCNRTQGVICFLPTGKIIKVFNKRYLELFDVRNNVQSVKFRYLEVRKTPKEKDLRDLYPSQVRIFDEMEDCISKMPPKLFQIYTKRNTERKYIITSPEEHKVLRDALNWYMEDKENNNVDEEVIKKIIDNYPAKFLICLIRRFRSS